MGKSAACLPNSRSGDNDHRTGCETDQLLRDASEKQPGKPTTAAPANNEDVGMLPLRRLHDRCGRIAPSGFDMNLRYTEVPGSFLRISQNPRRKRVKDVADAAPLGMRKLSQFYAGQISADRHDRETAAGGLRQLRRKIYRAIGAAGAVSRHHDLSHDRALPVL